MFTVTVKAGGQSHVCRRSVPVLPYGTPCRVTATGVAGGDATVTIAPPGRHWTRPTLQIAVSPTIERSLMDVLAEAILAEFVGKPLLGGPKGIGFEPYGPYSDDPADTGVGTEGLSAASDLMAALALTKLYPADSPERRMLDQRIRTTLSLLIAGRHEASGRSTVQQHGGHGRPRRIGRWAADKAGFDVPHEVLNSSLPRLRGSPAATRKAIWRPRPSCCMPWRSAVRATLPWPIISCATASCSPPGAGLSGPGPPANGPQGNRGRRLSGWSTGFSRNAA